MNNNKPIWPSEGYGKTRHKRKCPDGYEVIYSSNFPIAKAFRMLKKINDYKKTGKGYVVLDKAFDINNHKLPFHISMTVFIKREFIKTTLDRHNEFMWWIKVN